MSEPEQIAKMISTPGAMALVIVWIHFRTKRLEDRFDIMASHLGVPMPRRKNNSGFKSLLLLLLVTFVYCVVLALNFHNL